MHKSIGMSATLLKKRFSLFKTFSPVVFIYLSCICAVMRNTQKNDKDSTQF